VNNKTDKYILNILEDNHLQNVNSTKMSKQGKSRNVINVHKILFLTLQIPWIFLLTAIPILRDLGMYQMNNKTDKYILNIIEHNHLQNTMYTLLQIFIQGQHDIDSIS
jgi:hypothetical protein